MQTSYVWHYTIHHLQLCNHRPKGGVVAPCFSGSAIPSSQPISNQAKHQSDDRIWSDDITIIIIYIDYIYIPGWIWKSVWISTLIIVIIILWYSLYVMRLTCVSNIGCRCGNFWCAKSIWEEHLDEHGSPMIFP